MAFELTCPKCAAILRSSSAVRGGKKVRCPKCSAVFEAPHLEETAVAASPPNRRVADEVVDDVVEDDAAPEEEEETPRPRKRRRDDDDEDDEPRAPRRSRDKAKKKMGVGMLIGVLLVGGTMAVVACGGCGGLSYWLYTIYGVSPIVGQWEANNNPLGIKTVHTFNADGLGNVKVGNVTVSFKYTLKDNNLEIRPDEALPGPFGNVVERYTVTFQGNQMTLTSADNRPFAPKVQQFRRLK